MLKKIESIEERSKFTVKNKDLERQERIQGRSLGYMRYIKLYNKQGYLPVGQYSHLLQAKHKLSEKLIYKSDISKVPSDIIKEQYTNLWNIVMSGQRTGLIEMKTARGKCRDGNTNMIAYDGSIVNVKDIKVGDRLMGPDSMPRNVLSITEGEEEMFRIKLKWGEELVCNASHILYLEVSYDYKKMGWSKGDKITMSVKKYMGLNKTRQRVLKMIRSGCIEWDNAKKTLLIDPYYLGIWLGDGTKLAPCICNPDKEIHKYLEEYAGRLGLYTRYTKSGGGCPNIFITSGMGTRNNETSLLTMLKAIGVYNNKHIPDEYMYASVNDRLQLLAGLIDSDGGLHDCGVTNYYYTTDNNLAKQVLFLARSLGYKARLGEYKKKSNFKENDTTCYNISISGGEYIIPCKVKRKQANKRKDKHKYNLESFSIEPIGKGKYYGFELDGDHLFLLGNFVIAHNSNTILQLISLYQEKTLILVHNLKTLKEMREKFQKFTNYDPGYWSSKGKKEKEIMITTHASFVKEYQRRAGKFGLVIYDEADVNISDKMINALAMIDAEGLFGLTGTPKRQDLDTDDLQLIYGPLVKLEGQKNNGYNMIPKIWQLKYADAPYSFEDFHDFRLQCLGDESRIQKQIEFVKMMQARTGLALLLVDWVSECDLYHAMLSKAGVPNVIVNGETKIDDDEKNIAEMIEQKGVVVGTSKKIGRGVDIPAVQTIYLFCPVQFKSTVVQAVGRALRFYPDKKEVFLFDRADTVINQHFSRRKSYRQEYKNCSIKDISIRGDTDFSSLTI